MKKYILPILAIAAFGAASCDSFLEKYPKDKLTPETYFRNEEDLKLFSNSFYDNLLDKTPYDEQSDLIFQKVNISDELYGGGMRVEPTNASSGGWSWGQLRKINTMLGHMDQCSDEAVVKQYTGLARFFRAKFYFEKVKRFGDVPWYDTELDSTDPALFNARDSREVVMTHMLEDIDFAIDALPEDVTTFRANKWAAYMLKAQFCLFEGTYRKYHGLSYEGHSAEDYLKLAYEAAQAVMESGKYSLASDYHELFREADADAGEYILAIKMDATIGCGHSATAYVLVDTQGSPGIAKKFVGSFLMKDGTRFTDKENWDKISFDEEVKDRDPRLAMIMRTPDYVRAETKTTYYGVTLAGTATGYQLDKYVMDPKYETANRADLSFNDIPVFRLGEAYLIYAEAKAELNILTQDDVDKSINRLRDRVGMAHLELAGLTVDPFLVSDTFGYKNLAKVKPSNMAQILEVRRERTIELFLEASRWDDIRRWKEGETWAEPLYGMYFAGPGVYDLSNGNGKKVLLYASAESELTKEQKNTYTCIQIQNITINGTYVPYSNGIILSEGDHGYVSMHAGKDRSFDENRDYLYPIPIGDIDLNRNLVQNPGWSSGLSDGGDGSEDNGTN